MRTNTCCSVKSSTRDLWNSKLMTLWSLDLKPYANTCSINLVKLRKDLRLYKFCTYKFSISLPENVHHFTNICFSTLQVVPDKGNITHTRKSYYFVLCKSNIIIAIGAELYGNTCGLLQVPSAWGIPEASCIFLLPHLQVIIFFLSLYITLLLDCIYLYICQRGGNNE